MDKLLEIFYVAARRRILSRLFPVDSVIINNFTNIFVRVIWNSYTGNFGKLPFFLKVTCLYSRELPPPIKQNLRNVFWESSEIVRNFQENVYNEVILKHYNYYLELTQIWKRSLYTFFIVVRKNYSFEILGKIPQLLLE